MCTFITTFTILCTSAVLASINIRRAGWLDRVVEYQKKRFIDDFMKAPVPKIIVRLEKPPPGYIDSKDWDYDSVIRLLTLIRDSEGAAPVRRAFRRAMKTRRMTYRESFKYFPPLNKHTANDYFYDIDSSEYFADSIVPAPHAPEPVSDEDVIIVSNPVEAKLPSARISVGLLKSIMESRASAGRIMPTTALSISWPVTEKRNITAAPEGGTGSSDSVTEDAESTSPEATQTNDTPADNNTTETNSTSGNETAT